MKNYRLIFRQTDRDKFEEIANGLKTIETRAATTRYQPIQPGDSLTFVCGKDQLTKVVADVAHFDSLEEMFAALPLGKILPSVATTDDAKKVYFGFPGYKEKIEANGIVAFSLSAE